MQPTQVGETGDWTDEETFKILVATDNHIGVHEHDPVRGKDSINTFREILEIAVKEDVSCSDLR